jgi:cytochrome P450
MQLTDHLFNTSHKQGLPSLLPLPPLLQTLVGRWRPFDYAEKGRARYGNRFTLSLVDMPPLVLLSNPQDIKSVVTIPADNLHSGGGGALMEPLFGEHAFVLHDSDKHSAGRDSIMPAFSRAAVQGYADTVRGIVEHEIAGWPVDVVFSLTPYLDRLTLRVILETSIANQQESVYATLCNRIQDMLSVMSTPLLQAPRLRYLPGWHRVWVRFLHQRRRVDDLILRLIAERRGEGPAGDLLDLLLASHNADGSPMSDRQVRDNLMSVIIAGQETTASTLAWTFQLLAHNPGTQGRLIDEIDDGLSDVYMNATIQEALRHKPTFLFLPPRVVLQPTEIGGWSYSPPAQLLACIYLMQHDPGLYPNPHSFTPERFLGQTPRPGTLLPWGAGRKRCPGRGLALMEIQTVLCEALSTWRVLPAGAHVERPHWRTALLVPGDGSKVMLRTRGSRLGGRPIHVPERLFRTQTFH